MGIIKGGFHRAVQCILYLLAFCCAAIIIGVYSYFLSVLADRNVPIARDYKAIEGLSGVAVLYTIFGFLLTCCLGGITFFAALGLILDICFVGAFIALAILTRQGSHSCSGYVYTPIGQGFAYQKEGFTNGNGGSEITYSVSNGTACRLNKACFAVSIIGAFIFVLCALMQIVLARHHKKEKRFGPSPSNGYTSGSGSRRKGLFARKNKNATRDAELGAAGAGGLAVAQHDTRPSHETGYTGTTVGATNGVASDKVEPNGTHAGYYNQPTNTTANPYGYNTAAAPALDPAAPHGYNTTTGTATNY